MLTQPPLEIHGLPNIKSICHKFENIDGCQVRLSNIRHAVRSPVGSSQRFGKSIFTREKSSFRITETHPSLIPQLHGNIILTMRSFQSGNRRTFSAEVALTQLHQPERFTPAKPPRIRRVFPAAAPDFDHGAPGRPVSPAEKEVMEAWSLPMHRERPSLQIVSIPRRRSSAQDHTRDNTHRANYLPIA